MALTVAGGAATAAAQGSTLPALEPPPHTQLASAVRLQPEIRPDYGTIQSIQEGAFVIDDRQFEIGPSTVMRSRENGPATGKAAFEIGARVGYYLNEDVSLKEIWLDLEPEQ